ncbi:hypothetical protein FSP39_025438 [Pinctada imbricata]|uniref:Bromo domain-containing protein n=1 Tax=Pinctada imbricata TaxID=66713 RepID=A0AA89C8S4_PINIB|nr:hypothetical protein FSP39_025438 [Pinctada imbricata]
MNESQEVFDTNAEIKVELPDKTPAMTSENSVADDISTADAAAVVTQENDPESQLFQNSSEIDIRSVSSHTGSENSEENLTEELQQGLRILRELMSDSNKSVNWHFLWPVDDSMPDTANYYEKIQKPMWFNKMKEKFESGEYETITQFVADFRLMLENCYRYNGPDHFVSKRAQKLETMMEQKLTLLSRELREKTSIAATSGDQTDENFGVASLGSRRRTRAIIPHDSTALLNQLREQEVQREREIRKQQMVWRKKQQEDYHQQMIDWEDKIMEGKGQEMKAMWELPQMGLFLFLCQIPLNIGEVSQFELERCFYMPRESSALQRVMTALLSTPFQRTKIGKKWMMPYKVWEEKLRVKSRIWYQMYHNSGRNTAKVAEKFGLDPMFFSVLGHKNPLEKHKFHEISVYKRIWLVKSLCDYCLETQESLQNTLEGQPEEELRDYRLGVDAEGNTYLHFPQFCGADLRIYRQAYIPEPKWESIKPVPSSPKRKSSIDSEDEEQETPMRSKKVKKSSSSQKKKKRKQKQEEDAQFIPFSRPSHLRQTIKTVLPVPVFEESESSSSDSECSENDTVSQSDSTMNESSICDNTPDSRTKVNNKSLLRLQESDNFSDTSSVDCDYFIGRRLRSNRILRFEDESSRDSEQLSRSRRLTTRKSRTSVRTEMNGTITPDRGSDVGDSESGNNERTGQDSISKGRGRGQLGSVSSDNGTDISATPFDEENSNDTDSVRVSMFKKKLREERDGYSSDETMEGGDPQNIGDMEDVELEDGDGKKKEENDSCDLIENNSISDFSENSQSNCDSQKDVNSVMDEKGDGVTKQTFQDCDNRRSEHLSSQHLFNGDDLHVCREIHKGVSSAEETVHNDINESDLNSGKGDYLFDSGANINGEKEERVRTQSDKCLENDSYNSKQIQEAPSNECIKNDLMNTEVKDEEKGESVRTYRMNSEVFDVNGDSKSDSSESDMSELSRETKQDCELSTETKQDCELSRETKQDCELSTETKQDCELSTETKQDCELSRGTKQDCELSTETKQDCELSRETKQDCELSRETKQDCELSRETKQDCDIQNIPENCTGMIEKKAMSNEGYAGASIEDFKTFDEHTLIKEDEASITCEDSKVKTEKEDSICESGEESKVDIKKENEEDAQGIKTECEEKVYEDSTLTNGNIDEHDEEMNDDMKIEMKMDVDNKEGGVIKEEEGDDGKENVKKEDNTEEEKYNLTDENKANKTEDVKEEPQEDSEDEEEGLIMEAEEAGWESDKSERSCSDTEDADTDIENVGVEGDKNETRTPSNSQNSQEDGASIGRRL